MTFYLVCSVLCGDGNCTFDCSFPYSLPSAHFALFGGINIDSVLPTLRFIVAVYAAVRVSGDHYAILLFVCQILMSDFVAVVN